MQSCCTYITAFEKNAIQTMHALTLLHDLYSPQFIKIMLSGANSPSMHSRYASNSLATSHACGRSEE